MKTTFKEELIKEIADLTLFNEQKIKTALSGVWMLTPNVKIGIKGGGVVGKDLKVSGWCGRGDEKAWITIPTSWFAPLAKWCKDNSICCQRSKTKADCFTLRLL